VFAAPPIIETIVLAKLPEKFYVNGRTSRRYANRKFYLEGPVVARDGTFYFTDVPWGRIFTLSPDGEISLFLEYDGQPNGLKFHKDGRLFVADYRNGIVWVDMATKQVHSYCNQVANERLRGPNDLAFASNGDLYFTDQGNSDIQRPHGRVVRVRPDGFPEIILSDIASPNGLVVSPDDKWLYLAVTRTNNVWKVPLEIPPGLVSHSHVGTSGVFVQMSGGSGPDGMTVDESGNLLVAHTGFGAVWVFSSLGEPLYRVNTSAGLSISNLAFDVKDRHKLYITESATGSILTAHMPIAGHPLFGHLN
jgi:gluconolactonase